ncbi:uncharacterized protein J3D65DRAFT_141451 [Phyllosticta citribraziliensis]|uniref:Uncharacterized protein n=1 Tax=Phyllosticta citribraziliensis TaxID=989973 RepID=A0ABR1L6N8_9PEZI
MVADPNRRVVPPSPAWSWLSALVPPPATTLVQTATLVAIDFCPADAVSLRLARSSQARRPASRHPHSGLDALHQDCTPSFDSSADRRVSRPSHVKRNDMRRSPRQRYRYMYRLPRRVNNDCPQLGFLDVKRLLPLQPTCTSLPPVEFVRIARSLLAWNPATPRPHLLASWRGACPKEQLKRRRRAPQVKSKEISCLQLCWIRRSDTRNATSTPHLELTSKSAMRNHSLASRRLELSSRNEHWTALLLFVAWKR